MTDEGSWLLDVPFPAPGGTRAFDLAQPLRPGIPHYPTHPPFAFVLTKKHGDVVAGGASSSAELITLGGHVGTHVDGLAHVSYEGRVHGDIEIADRQSHTEGLSVHSVHELPPLMACGHLVDLPTLLGRPTTPDDSVGAEEFDRWFERRTPPQSGDVVLIRTGWDRLWADPPAYLGVDTGVPGVSVDGARWLTDLGIRATGADTVAYEHMPNPALPVHVHLLVDHGVPIMEAMRLSELVAAQAWTFFFIAVPLPIKGGTGSPIRPLACVSVDGVDRSL